MVAPHIRHAARHYRVPAEFVSGPGAGSN